MERDKRGRFVKKAQKGLQFNNSNFIITPTGKKFLLKPGVDLSQIKPLLETSLNTDPKTYQNLINNYFVPVEDTNSTGTGSNTSVNTPEKVQVKSEQNNPIRAMKVDLKIPYSQYPNYKTFTTSQLMKSIPETISREDREKTLNTASFFGKPSTDKIKYSIIDGKYIDEYGREISQADILKPNSIYTQVSNIDSKNKSDNNTGTSENNGIIKTDLSKGMNLTPEKDSNKSSSSFSNFINKERLADFLSLTRSGIGYAINNKIAERALEAEKPFLQDALESHRSVYGDYRAKIQGERAAAQLRNLASKPLTSDGALQQKMMLEAQIKGQEYIDKGNAQDEALIRQTREVAQQQEKENAQQRYATAMANRQAMLMSQKNKTQIENTRDAANYSQILLPMLSGAEQRLRNKAKEQEYYKDYYNNASIKQDVWNNFTDGLTPEQQEMAKIFNTRGSAGIEEYVKDDVEKQNAWLQLKNIKQNEIIRRQAAQRGVTLNIHTPNTDPYGFWTSGMEFKKGGTIYKAKLTKRTKDNDRAAKSIESSKKIAARFLEKAIDSLYTYKDVELVAKAKNKRKYQAGGSLPFVGYTPVFATSETGAPTKAAKEESKDDLTNKDVLQLLKEMDGLPADMGVIINQLQNFALYDADNGMSSSSDITSRYVSLIGKIKTAQFNKNEYNNAFNQLKDNGGLNEYAITSDGLLIGTNEEGDFKYFSVEDIKKGTHSEKGYQLLTNSNLLYLRANSPEAAFNHRLTTVAQNGIGMPTIDSLISSAVDKLGTDTQSSKGYISTKSGSLIQGLQEFYKAIEASNGNFDGTVNDLYKYKYLTKSQAEQAKKAMQYIYQTLPTNAKTLLKLKSDGSDSGAIKLIETLISSKVSNEQQVDLNLVGGKSHKETSSEKDSSDLKTSLPLNVLKGIGGVDTVINVDRGDGIHMSVRGTQYNLIKTPSGEAISDTSLANMLNSSGLQGIIKDLRGIQFGDQKIAPEALSNITYNNTGIVRANLPIKPDGSVDLEILERYEMAENEIDTLQDKSKENIQKIYSKYEISDLLLADGSYNQSKFAPFIVTEGYTTDALSGLQTSKFVKEFKGDDDNASALIQKSLAVGSGKNVQVPDVDTFGWYNPADWFGWTDKIYKGVVYIPITNNVNTAILGANQSIDYDEALVQEEKYQNFEKRSQQRSTGSDILNN